MINKKRHLQLDDLMKIEYLSSPALSPDGTAALYVVAMGGEDDGKFYSRIWRCETAAPSPAPLLNGNFQQKLPRFSPDGKTVFFLSDEGNPGVFQLWALGNGRKKLSSLRHGVSWYSVSPDGKALAFEAPLWPDETENALEELKGEALRRWKADRERKPIVIEEIMYKFDETYGIPDGSVARLGTLNLETGETRMLSDGSVPHHTPVFSPDGKTIACWRMPYGGWKKKRGELALYTLDGKFKEKTQNVIGLDEPPVFAGDGEILFSGYYMNGEDFHGAFYKTGADKEHPVSILPEKLPCWGPGDLVTGHTAYGYPGETTRRIGNTLYFLSADKSATGVYALDMKTDAVKLLTPEKCCISGFDVSSDGSLLCVKGTPEHIAGLYFYTPDSEERLLALHNDWMDEVEMNRPQELLVPSTDGKSMIHGWVLKPDGFTEGEKYPAVLDIHGGPECCYPFDWWFEFQYLAARGIAVVWCDPHGSISYGADYQQGAWDDIAYQDLMDFLDAAVALGFIDEKRLGVTGGSYGGYMTNYIIGRTSRFAAAVSQRNLCNRATSYGTGDMGSILETPFKGCYTSLINRMRGGSTTIKSIDRITTPLLILHATNDYRCSFEQGEQMFIAMKDRRPDVPVRFAAFPGENHGLTREGNMYAQRGHLLEMGDWFSTYLKDGPSPDKQNAAEKEGV